MTISRRGILTAGIVASMSARAHSETSRQSAEQVYSSVEAALSVASDFAEGTILRVVDKGHYQVATAKKAHLPPSLGNALGLVVLPVCGSFVAEHFGDAANARTAQYAVSAACGSKDIKSIHFGGAWSIESTVTFDDPEDVFVFAWGATFITSGEILAFDFNGRADPSYRDNESRQNFRWHGGRFRCTAGLQTTAAAVRMLGFRSAEFYPEDFKGWDTDIITGGKDTVRIGNYKTYNCRISIELPPWSTIGGPLMFLLENLHGSLHNRHGKLVRSCVPLSDSELRNFSCNLGAGADVDGAIDIARALLLAVDRIEGRFQPGETITGRASGARAVIDEVYTHRWPFRIPQPMVYLVGSNPKGAKFEPGEQVEGGTSGAVAVLAKEGHTQRMLWYDFLISGTNHFEAGHSPNGAIGVRLRDRLKRGPAPTYFDLRLGSVSLTGGPAVGLELEHIQGVRISARWALAPGQGVPIRLDRGCRKVTLAPNTVIHDSAIEMGGMPAAELTLPPRR